MENLTCTRCGAARETSDNFCRKCGKELSVTAVPTVPAVRPTTALTTTSRPASLPPSVIGGVAVLALTTGVEWMLRRMAGNAAKAAGRSLIPGRSLPVKQERGPREMSVDEVVYIRKVQLRR